MGRNDLHGRLGKATGVCVDPWERFGEIYDVYLSEPDFRSRTLDQMPLKTGRCVATGYLQGRGLR